VDDAAVPTTRILSVPRLSGVCIVCMFDQSVATMAENHCLVAFCHTADYDDRSGHLAISGFCFVMDCRIARLLDSAESVH